MLNKCTHKEEMAIEYLLGGLNSQDAVFKAYDCSTKASAKSLATRVFKKPTVIKRYDEKKAMLDEKTTQMHADFITLLEKSIPSQEVIDVLKKHIKGDDKRVSLGAIDQYHKLSGLYKQSGKSISLWEKLSGLEE